MKATNTKPAELPAVYKNMPAPKAVKQVVAIHNFFQANLAKKPTPHELNRPRVVREKPEKKNPRKPRMHRSTSKASNPPSISVKQA